MTRQMLTRHILVIDSSENRKIIELNNKIYYLGRHPNNDIVIDSEKLSRKHASFILKKNKQTQQHLYWILDGDLQGKKSHNGIFVNKKKCYFKELQDQDVINFGQGITAVYHTFAKSNLKDIETVHKRTTLILSQQNNPSLEPENLKQESPKHFNSLKPELNNEQKSLVDEQLIKNFDIFIKNSQLSKAENHLKKALEQNEFSLYYQPQYNIKTRKIDSLEALLRWQHPKKGLMLPNQFMSLAEKTELIIPIGEWVLKTACQQSKLWQKSGFPALSISVNLSSRQFCDPSLKKLVSQVIQETQLLPKMLELEITEKTIMQHENFANHIIEDLHNLGVNLSMDDFGTGYSSLSYLHKFPFKTLKIGQSFMKNFANKPEDFALLSAVIAWGHITKLNIVAEGVETEEQLELLRRLNFEKIQGYQISVPLTVEETTRFLFLNDLQVAELRK